MRLDHLDPRDREELESYSDPGEREKAASAILRFRRSAVVEVGEAAPALTLPRLDDSGEVRLDGPRDRPLVLIFGSYT